MAMDFQNDDFDWDVYYEAIKDNPPRETLITAMKLFEEQRRDRNIKYTASDIGCGSGRDTIELLRNGWKVYASDKEQSAINRLLKNLPANKNFDVEVSVSSFEELILPESNLVNASYCLPFCKPEYFYELWEKIEGSITSNGRFSGNFFGENDDWKKFSDMTFHTKEEISRMFEKFSMEYFHERDEDGETATGEKKHWHVYSIVAKKL